MSTKPQNPSPAVRKVLATIDDGELESRYPNRTHFVDARNPNQAILVSRALLAGDPVVVISPDDREVLFAPQQTRGFVGVILLVALLWSKFFERSSSGELIQLPPRTRVEVRDPSGLSIAA
jgi:hypothetical protein